MFLIQLFDKQGQCVNEQKYQTLKLAQAAALEHIETNGNERVVIETVVIINTKTDELAERLTRGASALGRIFG